MKLMDPDFPFDVTYIPGGPDQADSLEVSWDENDPRTMIFNSWSEDDFKRCFMEAAIKALDDND